MSRVSDSIKLSSFGAVADWSVQASNTRMVDEALTYLDYSDRVPSLTTSDAQLGRFTVAKASIYPCHSQIYTNYCSDVSSVIWLKN